MQSAKSKVQNYGIGVAVLLSFYLIFFFGSTKALPYQVWWNTECMRQSLQYFLLPSPFAQTILVSGKAVRFSFAYPLCKQYGYCAKQISFLLLTFSFLKEK